MGADDSIRVKDYTGALVTLTGEIGLAPEWKDGQCEDDCQEAVSACLMAFTNGKGNHVNIELTSTLASIGTGHDKRAYPFQEAAFYGNIFASPPRAYYCAGADFAGKNFGAVNVNQVDQRACSGWTASGDKCPYTNAAFTDPLRLATGKCSFFDDAATECAPSGSPTKSYDNVITTYRRTKGDT